MIRKKLSVKNYQVIVNPRMPGHVIEFSDAHLDINREYFNEKYKPEFTCDLSELGLDYVETRLIETSDIDDCLDTSQKLFDSQMYRKAKNKEFVTIKTDILMSSFDIREKPLQVVLDKNGKIEYVFNGNTTHSILSRFTNVQNRLVAVYTKNNYFSISNLILIAGNQNSHGKPFGQNSINDIEQQLLQIVKNSDDDLPKISKKSSEDERQKFVEELKNLVKYLSNGKINTDHKEINRIINAIIEEQIGEEVVFSVSNGEDVLRYLREQSNDYNDTPFTRFVCVASFPEKVFDVLINNLDKIKAEQDIDIENVIINIIIHMGVPNACDPVNNYWQNYYRFIKHFDKLESFLQKDYFNANGKSGKFRIVGVFQQVNDKELIESCPFKSVISIKKFKREYEKKFQPVKNVMIRSTVLPFDDEEAA